MAQLILRGVFVRFIDLRYSEKSHTVYTKINFTADFSDPVREELGWGEPAEGCNSAKLEGELAASSFILTPNEHPMLASEITISAKAAHKFEFFWVKVKDSDSRSAELRFQIVTTDDNAAALLQAYLKAMGQTVGQLKIEYTENAQIEMDLSDTEYDASSEYSDDTPEDNSERMISTEQAAATSEEADADFGESSTGSLAPAVLVGGTHAKRGRPRKVTAITSDTTVM